MKRMTMGYILATLAIVGVAAWFAKSAITRASYPVATAMPVRTGEPLPDLLRRLDGTGHTPRYIGK